MGYTIEISFDIRKQSSFTAFKNRLVEIAESKKCDSWYSLHEMEGGLMVERNHCVITISFENYMNCIDFIKLIKPIKKVYIECIYSTSPHFKIIYVSSYYYTKKMSKEGKQIYKNNKCSCEEEAIKREIICSK